ncbi:11346_t:CDS:2 [Rhizophagus irregularis]|nr:11346_t:CDS:2 [Rhizophagus irregularis]
MTTSSRRSEDEVKELAKVLNLGLRAIPDFVKQYSDVLLEVIDQICVDDPVIIDWTVPFPRNGRNQTKSPTWRLHEYLVRLSIEHKTLIADSKVKEKWQDQ